MTCRVQPGHRQVVDAGRRRTPEELGIQVAAAVLATLGALDSEGVCGGPGVLTDSSDDPAHLLTRSAARDREALALDLAGDVQCGGRRTDRGELVAEVGVEGSEIPRQP